MSRHGRQQPQPTRATAPSEPPAPAVAPPPAPGVLPPDASDVDAGPAPLQPPAVPLAGLALDDAAEALLAPLAIPAAPAPRFIARVRIHAGATYEPGDEIPESVAADGLTDGVEYRRET